MELCFPHQKSAKLWRNDTNTPLEQQPLVEKTLTHTKCHHSSDSYD